MLRRRLMKQQEDEVIDLSLRDIYGNPIERSTANCYVISKPGKYKFPLVYGNAIKNGKVNTAAFTNNGGTYSHDFVDSGSNIITSPYVTEQLENYHVPVLENYDDENVISLDSITTSFDDGMAYINFTVDTVPNQGANAIISITMDGSRLWNWHIWLWPHDLTPVEITNENGYKYNILPTNLASRYDSDVVHIKNWFYQWGRMAPMLLPSAWNSTTDHSPGSITNASKVSSLDDGITCPTTFYYNSSSPFNWFGGKSYYNLWDAACFRLGTSDNDTVKTVYDPCPVGWKVPNGNVFTGLSVLSSANGIFKLKRGYSTDGTGVEFPASRCRDGGSGGIGDIEMAGYYWTSASASEQYAYGFFVNLHMVGVDSESWRSGGYSIRPVEDIGVGHVEMIEFSIDGTNYQAEKGMTWFEWIYSEYNDDGFKLLNSTHISKTGFGSVCLYGGEKVEASDSIKEVSYSFQSGGA